MKINNITVEADLIPLPKKNKSNKKQSVKNIKPSSCNGSRATTTKTTTKVVESINAYNTPIYTVYINMKLDNNNKGICLNTLNKKGIRAHIEDDTIICGKFYSRHNAYTLNRKISEIGYISSIK